MGGAGGTCALNGERVGARGTGSGGHDGAKAVTCLLDGGCPVRAARRILSAAGA